MNKEILDRLVDKVNEGTATDEELAAYNAYLEQAITNDGDWDHINLGPEDSLKAELLKRINDDVGFTPNRKLSFWPRIAAAASIILALSLGGYYILHKQQTQQTAHYKNDVLPGHNQATLTLANGQKIIVTKALRGQVARQGGTVINAGDAITYTTANTTAEKIAYNTLSTAKGEQSPYPLILADGTKVWLNAASSVTFPAAFIGKERAVTVTGEAYFEVVHNAAKPFRIRVKEQTVEDIGTQFNINAYDDEPASKTTLLEGSIKVTKGTKSQILRPGQQALLVYGANEIRVQDIDTDDVVAWRNGMFQFSEESLESIMRKVSRWYDVDVEYQNNEIKNIPLTGFITHFSNVSKVLRMLELTKKVHFKIEGKKIIVTK